MREEVKVQRSMPCFCTYSAAVHDQSHLSGLVHLTPEGDARTGSAVAAVVGSASEG